MTGEAKPRPTPDPHARRLEAWDMLLGLGQALRRSSGRVRPSERVPFTLICGFLGAGKTTLVNRLLSEPQGRRIAVLVNDFGAVNIDAALIRTRSASALELSNGCICCSLAGGLANAVAGLLARPERPDAIVVEASGVAEPTGVAHVALANGALSLAGIVAVADCETLPAHLADPALRGTVEAQLRAADLVLLNKVDLAGQDHIRAARAAITKLVPTARIVETVAAEVPAELVLGLPPRAAFAADATAHVSPFASWRFESARPLDDRCLAAVAGALPPSILRAKGIVQAASDPSRRFVLQVVGCRWTLEPEEPWDGPPRSEIVLIGLPEAGAAESALAALRACEAEISLPEPTPGGRRSG